jgi:hypothetical protein
VEGVVAIAHTVRGAVAELATGVHIEGRGRRGLARVGLGVAGRVRIRKTIQRVEAVAAVGGSIRWTRSKGPAHVGKSDGLRMASAADTGPPHAAIVANAVLIEVSAVRGLGAQIQAGAKYAHAGSRAAQLTFIIRREQITVALSACGVTGCRVALITLRGAVR